jgi:hypothetical protein
MASELEKKKGLSFVQEEFSMLSTVVHADTASPMKVKSALLEIRKAEKPELCGGLVLYPSVVALAQGKRILEVADEAVCLRAQSESHLIALQEVHNALSAVVEKATDLATAASPETIDVTVKALRTLEATQLVANLFKFVFAFCLHIRGASVDVRYKHFDFTSLCLVSSAIAERKCSPR